MALFHCSFFSRYLSHETQVELFLPDDNGSGKPYRLLYLLHGRGDDCTGWVRNTMIEQYANQYGIAVAMPSAETSFYVDGVYGKRYYSYLTRELPEKLLSWFPLSSRPEDTYIAGLSMGGYGALKIGLTLPERFAAIGVFSAGIRPDQFPDFCPTPEDNEILHEDVRRAFGDHGLEEKDIPEAMLAKCVENGRRVPPIFHYEGRQDMLYEMNANFRDYASTLSVPYHYDEWDGEHCWVFWNEAIQKYLSKAFVKEEH